MKLFYISIALIALSATVRPQQPLTPQQIQATVQKAQAALSAAQTDLAKISPATPSAPAAPAPPAARRVEIVPEVLISRGYRAAGLVGIDSPTQRHFMVLAGSSSIPPELAKAPISADIQKWADALIGPNQLKGGLFDDLDKNGLTTFEEFACGDVENPWRCGWVTATRAITLHTSENLDAGITQSIEVGDGKKTWRPGVEGTDFKASDFGNGQTELKFQKAGANIRLRILQSLHPADSPVAFLRVRLSKDF